MPTSRRQFTSNDLPLCAPATLSPVDSQEEDASCRASCGTGPVEPPVAESSVAAQMPPQRRRGPPLQLTLNTTNLPPRAPQQHHSTITYVPAPSLGRPHEDLGCTCGCWVLDLSQLAYEYFRPPVSYAELELRPAAAAFFPAAALLGPAPTYQVLNPAYHPEEPADYYRFAPEQSDRDPTAVEDYALRAVQYAMARATQRVWMDTGKELKIDKMVLQAGPSQPTYPTNLPWYDNQRWVGYLTKAKSVELRQAFWRYTEAFSGFEVRDVILLWRSWAGRGY